MYINVDTKALEWVVCAHLSKDKVAIKEIENNIDQHTENQILLRLPEDKNGRLIAKIFVFRLIYGSVAVGFANDPDFDLLNYSEDKWQELIDTFYNKYKGIETFHQNICLEVRRTGQLKMPTGRIYKYDMKEKFQYIRPKILNYPVQGLGHDLMTIARVSLYNKFKDSNLESKLVSTIHDSIIIDAIPDERDKVINLIKQTWLDVPRNYESLFNDKWTLPFRCEISVGNNLKDMEVI